MNPIAEFFINVWLYGIAGVAGAMIAYLIVRWKDIPLRNRLAAFFTLSLCLHVLEEWVCPAGLHYIHNIAVGSTDPNCYPMNEFSDMITNSVAVIFALGVLWKLSDNGIALLTEALFGIMEAIAHTRLGIIAYSHFHAAGLGFPYSPGLVTAIFGFLVVAIFIIADLHHRGCLHWKTLGLSFVSLLVVLSIIVLIPENGMKDINTPYRFPSAGFYQKYIK